jgi:hypothetical protein
MARNGGINAYSDLARQTIDGADLNRVWDEVQSTLRIFNQNRTALGSLLTTPPSSVRAEAVAQGVAGSSFEVSSEFGVPQSQRLAPDSGRLGFPFRWYDSRVGFTWRWLTDATAAQVQAVHNQVMESDNRMIFNAIMRALLVKTTIATREFNEDGTTIFPLYDGETDSTPPDFAGASFAAGHQHYLTSGATLLDSGDVEALLNHVLHHGFAQGDGARMFILANPAQADIIAGFRAGIVNNNASIAKFDFIPSVGAPAFISAETINGERPPATFGGLKIVGSYGDAYIVSNAYMQSGYIAAVASEGQNSPTNPLAFRQHPNANAQGLVLIPGGADYPLTNSFYTRGFGIGVRQRGAAAVMQITTNGTYTSPSISIV